MATAEKHKCDAPVYYGSWGQHRPCTRTATVQEDGRWHCTQHSNAKANARRTKRELKGANENKLFWARQAQRTDLQELLAALRAYREYLPAAVRKRWDAYDMSLKMVAQYEREREELK